MLVVPNSQHDFMIRGPTFFNLMVLYFWDIWVAQRLKDPADS